MQKAIIVGTVSNVSKTLEQDLYRALKSFSRFSIENIILVESDSGDRTLEILNRIAREESRLLFFSFGDLKSKINDRIERIRYCRNIYIDYLHKIYQKQKIDFVIVIDLDGINNGLNAKSVNSCFICDDWDVVLPNQVGGYYDLLALRCKGWQTEDFFTELEAFRKSNPYKMTNKNHFLSYFKAYIHFDKSRKEFIYSKMKKIKKNSHWIRVESGFGGVAIYKADLFEKFNYGKVNFSNRGHSESEHVTLNMAISKSGAQIYINPRFINSKFNTYNLNRFYVIRFLRFVYRDLKLTLKKKLPNFK